jgi:predicted DNA-binding transcriptional regulator AlpA
MLSVREAARLSGFSRQYINKLIANGVIDAKKNNDGNYVIAWKKFVRWFSALPITLTSPIGYASYSLKELMRYTGMSRCWVLKFATRNSIPSYYVGMYRRFCKYACEEAWKRESIALKRWLTIEEACTLFDVDAEVIFALAALHRTRVKRQNKSLFYNKADILSVVKKGGTLCHE